MTELDGFRQSLEVRTPPLQPGDPYFFDNTTTEETMLLT